MQIPHHHPNLLAPPEEQEDIRMLWEPEILRAINMIPRIWEEALKNLKALYQPRFPLR